MTAAADARFRKLVAADETAMRLYSWGARVLYLGPTFGLTAHRNAVAVVAVGLDAPFGVANDPVDPAAGYRLCRSTLIPPNTLHHLADTVGRLAFLYVDARSRDLDLFWHLATERTARAGFDLKVEAVLIDCLRRLARDDVHWDVARRTLDAALGTSPATAVDPRVKRAMQRMQADPASRLALCRLAREAGLSESRFLHLFKAMLGVPFRRYRLWIAMGAATRAIARGESLTTAALDAGFASSAHFSASFRNMFGLEPSRLRRGRLVVVQNGDPP